MIQVITWRTRLQFGNSFFQIVLLIWYFHDQFHLLYTYCRPSQSNYYFSRVSSDHRKFVSRCWSAYMKTVDRGVLKGMSMLSTDIFGTTPKIDS